MNVTTLRIGSRAVAFLLLAMVLSVQNVGVVEAQRGRRRAPVAPRTGTLVVRSGQNGAQVYVDEALAGAVPLAPQMLTVGEHTLRVQLPGYTDYTDVFTIDANSETALDVELLAVASVINVNSTPAGAQVFVDNRFSGETPVHVELLEGDHSLRLHLPGFHDFIQQVQGVAGHAQELNLTLEALPADEDPTHVEAAPRNWYEKPWTWVAVGVAAIAITVGVILLVSATSGPRQIDEYCMTGQGCVIIQPGF